MRALFSGTEGVRGVCTEHFTWPKPVANPRTGSFHPPGPTTRRGSPPSHWQARSRNPRHARRGRVFVSVELESCQRRRVGPPPPHPSPAPRPDAPLPCWSVQVRPPRTPPLRNSPPPSSPPTPSTVTDLPNPPPAFLPDSDVLGPTPARAVRVRVPSRAEPTVSWVS